MIIGALGGILAGLYIANLGNSPALTSATIYWSSLIGGVFIDLLKMILVPLIFSSIIVGISNLKSQGQIHQVWVVTLIYSLITMTLSVVVGVSASHIFKPGAGLNLNMFANYSTHTATHLSSAEFIEKFLHGLLMNPFAALAHGNVLSIIVISIIIGIALVASNGRTQHLSKLFQEMFELSLVCINWIMKLAPIGIFALLTKLLATQSTALLGSLIKFILVVFGTTIFHGLVILPLILFLVAKINPLKFFRGAKEALVMAFATSSSSATMPVTLKCAEEKLGVSPSVTGFVVPLGAHLNMDGTALYEGAAALFVANLVGLDLSFAQQVIICLTAMSVSVGAPGIPSAGMVTMVMVLQSVNLPVEAIAILLPIDRLLDTIRTAVNVEGDMVGCLVVQHMVNPSNPS
jgi:Na+/H+-dicarboxylate symporter